ncbi:periplasmic binding protein-like II [Piromyces finnis]|uniref:Periplasmic binding protein-like II n=1 Tax=Piromyces finnis TaxID=1754191 RepID=A0A1Y1V3N9_9FUNG|nr:periplasmic binding protein-like II [Piromyces finnis]|eukprot:ORX46582.1 periplasmic binding protein-like II [Piromyces finnis]
MRKIHIIYFITYAYSLIYFTIAKTVNLAVINYDTYTNLYSTIESRFNEYSKSNNLGIELKITTFSKKNTTLGLTGYDSTIDDLIQQKSTEYDMYYFDPVNIKKYSTHFADLTHLLPKDHLNMYSSNNIDQICKYNNQWVGLPLSMKFMVLYSNIKYLEKYNKRVPLTWDELIQTTKYILNQEQQNNNSELIGYNGYFSDVDNSICSFYDFIYSFRNSKDSPLPEMTSQTAIKALNKMKEVKDNISSNDLYKANDQYTTMLMYKENILFAKYWDLGNISGYKMSPMPGDHEGVNGSCLEAFNIGINNYISNHQKKAAAEVLRYLTSIDEQKNIIVMKFDLFSGISSIYDDKDVCSKVECATAKNIQGISKPSSSVNNYETFSMSVIDYINEFLFGDRSEIDTLTDINDITKIYYFSKSDTVGLIFFISLLVVFYVIFLSPLLLFVPRFENNFKFMNVDSWIIYTMGSLLIVGSEFTKFEKLNETKCYLNHILMTMGYTLIFIPVLYQLIINYPKSNSFSEWVRNHKSSFFFLLILLEIVFNILMLITPFESKNILIENNKNYNMCKFSSTIHGYLLSLPQFLTMIIFYSFSCFLIYTEWKVEETKNEIKSLSGVMCIDGILIILLNLVDFVNINNYIIYYSIHAFLIIIFSLSNHIYLFILRLIFGNIIIRPQEDNMIEKLFLFNDESNSDDNITSFSFI